MTVDPPPEPLSLCLAASKRARPMARPCHATPNTRKYLSHHRCTCMSAYCHLSALDWTWVRGTKFRPCVFFSEFRYGNRQASQDSNPHLSLRCQPTPGQVIMALSAIATQPKLAQVKIRPTRHAVEARLKRISPKEEEKRPSTQTCPNSALCNPSVTDDRKPWDEFLQMRVLTSPAPPPPPGPFFRSALFAFSSRMCKRERLTYMIHT
ncbi:hypothetical protein J3F84DRAFT_118326 [Trichoderma pleuroticola]